MSKLYEVEFIGTYNTEIISESNKQDYENEPNVLRVNHIEECQTCGKKTQKLDIVGTMARCKECENRYHDSMNRAQTYMSAHDDDY